MRTPTAEVIVGGVTISNINSIEVSRSSGNNIGSFSVVTTDDPGILPEMEIVIRQGYDGSNTTTFTGYVDSIDKSVYPQEFTIQGRDRLKKMGDTFLCQAVKFGQDIDAFDSFSGGVAPSGSTASGIHRYYYSTYTTFSGGTFHVHGYATLDELHTAHPETSFDSPSDPGASNISDQGAKAHAVVQWLMVMSGIEESTQVQCDESKFYIGDISPAEFYLSTCFDAAIQIGELIGWSLYCDNLGVCHFSNTPVNQGSVSVAKTFTPQNSYKITLTEDNLDLRNYVEVRGSSGITYSLRAPSPYLGTTPYRGAVIADDNIDSSGIAKFTAQRILSNLNRLKSVWNVESEAEPGLMPYMGIAVDCPFTTDNNRASIIESISTNMSADGGYTMNITTALYSEESAAEEMSDPVTNQGWEWPDIPGFEFVNNDGTLTTQPTFSGVVIGQGGS